MRGIAPEIALAIAIVTVVWLVLFALTYRFRTSRVDRLASVERGFVALTIILGALWAFLALAPPPSLPPSDKDRGSRSCVALKEGMTMDAVDKAMKTNPRVVPEEDARGPGAIAWVYEDERCIAHFLDAKVVAVTRE